MKHVHGGWGIPVTLQSVGDIQDVEQGSERDEVLQGMIWRH
jgi:hypothetical protein